MSTVRYAVVGLNHGKSHVDFALAEPSVELAAICDANAETLAATAPGESVQRSSDYAGMLAWGEFDAVIIAVPPALHKDFAIQALAAGKHVFLEKPLTGDLAAARELRDAVKAAEPVFQVGYCVRSSQLIQRARNLITAGALGEVVNVWWQAFARHRGIDHGWRTERVGCLLFDCAPHYLDILTVLAGAPFRRLTAYGTDVGGTGPGATEIPRVVTIAIEFENGVKGSYQFNEVTPGYATASFGIAGTEGIIYGDPWFPDGAGSLKCQLNGGLYHDELAINGKLASRGHLGFREQHLAFLEAIRTGDPAANPCDIEAGYGVEVLMAAVDRSLATGETVHRTDMETA